MKEGALPVRYQGLPLFSKRLTRSMCEPLIQRLNRRLASWKRVLLSLAGRIELVKSV